MREMISHWYTLLSTLSAGLTEPVSRLGDGLGVPLVSVFLFGLIGALSPCQLTTGAGALAYMARRADGRQTVTRSVVAYLLGKALVYTLLGGATILIGQQLAQRLLPVVAGARLLVGPLMLLLGLSLLGWVPLRVALGHRLAGRLAVCAGSGAGGAFLLGVALAVTFCPTLFLLFFGLTVPLALRSPLGVVYPAVFALGMTLPLLGLARLFKPGGGPASGSIAGARRLGAWLRPAAAVVLLLAGLHDTMIYWVLA